MIRPGRNALQEYRVLERTTRLRQVLLFVLLAVLVAFVAGAQTLETPVLNIVSRDQKSLLTISSDGSVTWQGHDERFMAHFACLPASNR